MKIAGGSIIVLIVVGILGVIAWTLIGLGGFFLPNPPAPVITYGEFPFRLEYELDGQRFVVEDTFICEFDGFGYDEGRLKYRKWKQSFVSGIEQVTLLKVSDSEIVYYYVGSANYYMGDATVGIFEHPFPNASLYITDGRKTSKGFISADDLMENQAHQLGVY